MAAAALAAACASPTIAPPPPALGPLVSLPAIAESTINVRASVNYAAMTAAANSAVPTTVVNMSKAALWNTVTFTLKGARSDIKVASVGDQIGFSTNVHVDGTLDSACIIGVSCDATLKVDGSVWGSVRPTINPDWTVNLFPSGQFAINNANLSVSLLPGSVSVKDPLTKLLQTPFNDLVGQVNEQVSQSLVLKSLASNAWEQLAKPIAISASPPVWLVVNPSRILTEQPAITDQGVELGTALVARPELIVGDKPADSKLPPLPNLTIVDQVPNQFSLYLPVRLTYDSATQLAQQTLVGKTLQVADGITVTVNQVGIFNNGNEMGVKVDFKAVAQGVGWQPTGTLYFLGTPVYDLTDGYIAVTNLHFDVKTHDTLLQLAAWLEHQALIDALQEKLHFDVRDQVEARKQDLDKAINGTQLSPQVSLSGQVTSLAPSAVYLTRDFLQVNVVALGTFQVAVH